MLARRLPGILPPLTLDEALEVTKIYSVSGHLGHNVSLVTRRPFRSPHHTVSNAAISGGGSNPRPGEVSLAHFGVLFLDELPEFKRDTLEVLRQPLEDGHVTISRVAGTMTYPAQMMLVAAMNPCPCGYYGDSVKQCSCSQNTIQKYLQRISGPLLDRIDIHMEVPRLKHEEMLHSGASGEPSDTIRERVVGARERQARRFASSDSLHCNAHMRARQIREYCPVADEVKDLLRAAIQQLGLSARAYDRILKLSRTVADLDDKADITLAHVAESIQYRALDRKLWG
jgi:magnesium chelatase family protein